MKKIEDPIKNFSKLAIGIVGDLMLDRYLIGDVERTSPEAPAPVLLLREEKRILGGAANVAANVKSLGAIPILFGRVGRDHAGEHVVALLKEKKIAVSGIFRSPFPTTQKSRVLARGQQIVRIDEENTKEDPVLDTRVIPYVERCIPKLDAVIVSDYAKGFVTAQIAKHVVVSAKKAKISLIVDAKPKNAHFFMGATLFTPNKKEAEEISGISIHDIKSLERAGKKMQAALSAHILITRGSEGMSLFYDDTILHLPSVARKVYDVTGAGDTSVTAYTLACASGCSPEDSARLATLAAGIVVGKQGTAVVAPEELRGAMRESKIS